MEFQVWLFSWKTLWSITFQKSILAVIYFFNQKKIVVTIKKLGFNILEFHPQKQISRRVFQELNPRKKNWNLMTYVLYLCFQKSKITKYIWKPQHFCTSFKLGPGFPTPYVVMCLRSVV
jgi:hypothetical protein